MMLLYCLATTSTAPFLNISQVYQVNQFGTSTDRPNNIIARACKCNAMQSIYTCSIYYSLHYISVYTGLTIYNIFVPYSELHLNIFVFDEKQRKRMTVQFP